MSAVPQFQIAVTEDAPGRHRIAASGELDMFTVPDLRAQARRTARQAEHVCLDLRDVTFIDSSGLSLLVGLDAESRSEGFAFAIRPGPAVTRLIELCGLRGVLPVED